jgi:hypothetical protein
MTPALVLAQLLDLPPTFRRPGDIFQQIYNSLAAGEASYGLASDGSASALALPDSLGPWLALWGQVFGLPRLAQEGDIAYAVRLQNTLTSPVATPEAVQGWSRFFLDSNTVVVTEALPGTVGYVIEIPAGIGTQTLTNWILSLARIRPAGVPFQVAIQTNPLMLGTYSYIGAGGFAGAYLGYGTSAISLSIPAETGNAVPLVPEILLLDPTLNGQLASGLPT